MAALRFIAEDMLLFALVFGGIWLVKRLLHKRLSPAMHYLLWGVVVLKLLMPVSLPSAASPWNLFPAGSTDRVAQAQAPQNVQTNVPAASYAANLPAVAAPAASGGALAAGSALTQTTPAPIPATQPLAMSLGEAAALAWLCGAVAVGARQGLKYRRLGSTVRGTAARSVPPVVERELAKLRMRLGIRTQVRVMLQSALPVPAIMGFTRPVILLPEGIEADKATLKNALLHELAHFKRGDLLVLRLMNVLCAIYWFNPLVWLCFGLIRGDMEAACDSTALRLLGEDKRMGYVKTVLHFAGFAKFPSTHAAMSINDGRMAMKRRVERMFMKSSTGLRTKVTAVFLALAIGLAGFTTACKPNPSTPPVVGKGDLQNEITVAPKGSAIPSNGQKVQFTAEQGKLHVDVNAVLSSPESGKLPVEMVTSHGFTQADVDKIVKTLFQGKPAYGIKDYLTKSELNKMILELKQQLAKMDKSNKEYDGLQSAISEYEQQLATAPDSDTKKPSDCKLKPIGKGGGQARGTGSNQTLNVTAKLGKKSDAAINIMVSQSGKTCSLWFTNMPEQDDYLGQAYALNGKPKGVSMSLDDARALAEKTVKDMGSDLKLAQCFLSVSRNTLETANGEATGKQAYLFMFTREVNGVPTTYEENPGGNYSQSEVDKMNSGAADYIETHAYERIEMAVDDTGVLEIQWTSPDDLRQLVTDNAKALSLDQALDTFKAQFFIHNALINRPDNNAGRDEGKMSMGDAGKSLRAAGIYSKEYLGNDRDIQSCTYSIDRIVLGLSRVSIKDKPDEFMIVPVYDFFGSVHVQYTKESGYPEFTSVSPSISFLTINAIDGSIIDRSLGY